ncbi:MAG: hypothetical protein WBC51_11465 [Vicinamibacterales bacterium]|jgi:hypothetical protein
MAYEVLTEPVRRGHPRGMLRRSVVQLGPPHFWLLAGVLGFMIALVVLVVFTQLLAV